MQTHTDTEYIRVLRWGRINMIVSLISNIYQYFNGRVREHNWVVEKQCAFCHALGEIQGKSAIL